MSTEPHLTSSEGLTANNEFTRFGPPPPTGVSAQNQMNAEYNHLGGAAGFLGKPISVRGTIASSPNGLGYFIHYQGGSIYRNFQTGAHEVHGAIRDKWASLGWEQSFLGFPVTDETGTPDGSGRYNHFQGGSIYWTPATGAHEVHGAIRDKWAALGWERSFLGYPTSDEASTPDGRGRISQFQNGTITWTEATGAVEAPTTRKWHADVTFSDSNPLGGWVDFVADDTGAFTFSGQMRDTGFDPISFTIAVAIITSTGMAYGFGFSGRCAGSDPLSSGKKISDWMGTPTSTFKDLNGNVVPNPNPAIAGRWSEFAQGQMQCRITAQDLTAQGVGDFVTQAVQDLAKLSCCGRHGRADCASLKLATFARFKRTRGRGSLRIRGPVRRYIFLIPAKVDKRTSRANC